MNRHVALVVDWPADDAAWDDVLGRLWIGLPDTSVTEHAFGPGGSLAAGRRVAALALAEGDAELQRLIVHDVAAREGEPGTWPQGAEPALLAARSRTGALVVGPNRGWAWSPAVAGLSNFCVVDVDDLVEAVVHTAKGHPHTVEDVIARAAVPPLPDEPSPAVIELSSPARQAR